MTEILPYLASGTVLGVIAGFMPSPLTTLVITETLQHNKRQGVIVASVPLITDAPIIIGSLFVLSRLTEFNAVLGVISLLGAIFLVRLACKTFSVRGVELDTDALKPDSLRKGVITNFLNPNPYLFWATIGGPMILQGYGISWFAVAAFLGTFFFFVIGVKMFLAVIVERCKTFMNSRTYIYILRGMGALLLVFSGIFAKDGLKLLGAIP